MAGEVTSVAANTRSGLTVADLFQFVQLAEREGVDPRTPVKVRVGFRQQLVAITADPVLTQREPHRTP